MTDESTHEPSDVNKSEPSQPEMKDAESGIDAGKPTAAPASTARRRRSRGERREARSQRKARAERETPTDGTKSERGVGPTGWLAPVVVAAIIGAIVGAGSLVGANSSDPVQGTIIAEPIRSSVLLCPEPGTGGNLGVRVTGAVIPGQPGQEGEGEAGLRTLPGAESASSNLKAPGEQGQIEAFGTELPAIEAYGEGALAPGLIADQWGRDPSGQGRGMASTACAPAGSDFWFVGGGAVAGRITRVVLVNPDVTSAIVDVIIHGPDGEIDTPTTRGLVVPGQDRIIVRLDEVAPGVNGTAFHVIARSGRVGASVDDEQRSGLESIGTDWIPAAAEPATTVYVPGILAGDGARVLSVVSTSDNDAIVEVRVLAQDGSYLPFERGSVTVPAGAVTTLDMTPALPPSPDGVLPAALQLTSDHPIVAGMRQFFGGRNVQNEASFTAGAQPFTGPAAVSGLPVRTATDVKLQIVAPATSVEVDVTMLPFRGGTTIAEPTDPVRVSIPAGEVRVITFEPPTDVEWFTGVITPAPGSGPILAAHRVKERSRFGDLITGYPWKPLRVRVPVPQAVPDAAVATR